MVKLFPQILDIWIIVAHTHLPLCETAILCLDRDMDRPGRALIHFLTKSAKILFHNAQKEAIWQKKNFEIGA